MKKKKAKRNFNPKVETGRRARGGWEKMKIESQS